LRPLVDRLIRRLKGLSIEISSAEFPRSKLLKSSTLSTSDSTQLSSIGNEHENHMNWNALMSRTVDLEGIRTDGFGYQVVITGPSKEKRLLRKRGMVAKQASRTEPDGMEVPLGKEEKSSGLAIEVVMQNTFDVSETFQDRDIVQGDLRRNLSIQRASHCDQSSVDRDMGGVLDWSLLDTPEVVTALPSIRRVQGNVDKEAHWASTPIESLEQLTLPSLTAIKRNSSLQDVPSLARLLSVKGKEKHNFNR
jgi:hypothetical protein